MIWPFSRDRQKDSDGAQGDERGGGVVSNQHLRLRLQQGLRQPLLSQNRS